MRIAIREELKAMYVWSPWRQGSFTFAGLEVQQLKGFSIRVTQETFSNSLQPVEISEEASHGPEHADGQGDQPVP